LEALTGGVFGMYSGDATADGLVNAADRTTTDNNKNILSSLLLYDF